MTGPNHCPVLSEHKVDWHVQHEKANRSCYHPPDKARKKSQSPNLGGPHQVQIRIFPALIFYNYGFGQNLDARNDISLDRVKEMPNLCEPLYLRL